MGDIILNLFFLMAREQPFNVDEKKNREQRVIWCQKLFISMIKQQKNSFTVLDLFFSNDPTVDKKCADNQFRNLDIQEYAG